MRGGGKESHAVMGGLLGVWIDKGAGATSANWNWNAEGTARKTAMLRMEREQTHLDESTYRMRISVGSLTVCTVVG